MGRSEQLIAVFDWLMRDGTGAEPDIGYQSSWNNDQLLPDDSRKTKDEILFPATYLWTKRTFLTRSIQTALERKE